MKRVAWWFLGYVVVFCSIDVYRWKIWSFGTDTGAFARAILNTFSGSYDSAEQASHYAFHWSPIIGVLYPLVALTHSPLSIQFAQVLLVGASVFPFYAIVRRYSGEPLASRIALLALFYPALMSIAFEEFHEMAFFPLVLFSLVWAIDAGRWAIFFLCSIAAVLIREDVLIAVAVLGAALVVAGAVQRSNEGLLFLAPRAPAATMLAGGWLVLLSLGVFAAYFKLVIPAVGGWRPTHFYSYPFADGPVALLAALVTQPLAVVREIANYKRLSYLLEVFVPLLFLPLRSVWFLVALPGLLIVLLSSEGIVWRMGEHYAGLFAPQLLLGTAATLVAMSRRRSHVAQRALSFVFGLFALFLIAFNPMHIAHYLTPPYRDLADARRAFAVVPRAAAVTTHDEWYSHYALVYPNAANSADLPTQYAVFADDYTPSGTLSVAERWTQRQTALGRFRVIAQFGRVKVYERRNLLIPSGEP